MNDFGGKVHRGSYPQYHNSSDIMSPDSLKCGVHKGGHIDLEKCHLKDTFYPKWHYTALFGGTAHLEGIWNLNSSYPFLG